MSDKDREVFHFMARAFDVTEAQRYIKEHNVKPIFVEIKDLRSLLPFIRLDEKHIKEVDVTKPGIALFMPDMSGYLLIDGWHRLAKRIREDFEFMQIYPIADLEAVEKISIR